MPTNIHKACTQIFISELFIMTSINNPNIQQPTSESVNIMWNITQWNITQKEISDIHNMDDMQEHYTKRQISREVKFVAIESKSLVV